MKRFIVSIISVLVAICMCSCSSTDRWRNVEGIMFVSEDGYVEFYRDCMNERYPYLFSEENKCLEFFQEEYPEKYEKMEKPVPANTDSGNIIIYTTSDGTIWYTDGKNEYKLEKLS